MKVRPDPGELARIACLLEVTARKPGNVHRHADFDDAHYLDFLLSASAIGRGIGLARTEGIGPAIEAAVEDTLRVVATNTNLGMILLLAPLAAVADDFEPRSGVAGILDVLTIDDARCVYRAIRRMNPGGLGRADDQDIDSEPTVTLLGAMRLAADRDLIARQYATAFADVFDLALPALRSSLAAGHPLESSIIASHLQLMASCPDTLIARKLGPSLAEESARRAASVLASGWPDAPDSASQLTKFDAWLRADGHARNPGATADLVAATLFLALRDGTIKLPLPPDWSSLP
jgi:triphosphoribosyl-dephospho-CoA synthase